MTGGCYLKAGRRVWIISAVAATLTLRRERNLIVGVLIVLAAACWGMVAWQANAGGATTAATGTAAVLTMGMGIALFMAMWVSMMAAMMFPTAAPMILIYARVQSTRRAAGRAYGPTGFFTAAYLGVWAMAGGIAFAGALLIGALADHVAWLQENGSRISGGLVLAAGVYQLTPLKAVCLRHCRSPLSFVLNHWREGRGGALTMGLQHGLYCVGCCWLLFVLLFPLGIMNLAAMAILTVVIFLEKSTAWGNRLSLVFGVALIAYGLAVVAAPALLPGAPSMMGGMSG